MTEQVEKKKEEKESGQFNLFASEKKPTPFIYKKHTEWPRAQLLDYEKSVVGFYLSGHPMDHFKPFMKACGCAPIATFKEVKEKKQVCVGGIVSEFREVRNRKGNMMAFARLEDGTGGLEVVFFADVFLKYEKIIRSKNRPLIVTGEFRKKRKTISP